MIEARHAIVLLAAGESRRLGVPKQLLTIDGEPLVRRAARAALATCPAQALIVVGARADDVYAAVADLALTRVACAEWEQGLSASIQAGVRAVDPELAAALFVLADQPALDADHLRALIACWRDQGRQGSGQCLRRCHRCPGRSAARMVRGALYAPWRSRRTRTAACPRPRDRNGPGTGPRPGHRLARRPRPPSRRASPRRLMLNSRDA